METCEQYVGYSTDGKNAQDDDPLNIPLLRLKNKMMH